MTALLDHVVAHTLALHVRLLACQARLAADTDSEALHDLRTSVRRLRSLIRPLRGAPGVDQLEDAARAVGALTTPLRDREVLAAQLLANGQAAAGQVRARGRAQTYAEVARSAPLTRLLSVIDAFPRFLRAAHRDGVLKGLGKQVDRRLAKQWRKLEQALQDPEHDQHRLRLLIKRVRYAAEAYPKWDPVSKPLAQALKRAQGDLGDWHDRLQWLAQAGQHADLAASQEDWTAQLQRAEARSEKTLRRLRKAVAKR